MKLTVLIATVVLLLPGCASYSGRGLVGGQSTVADVEASMGRPAERLKAVDGDTILFYPRQPYGRQMYAVRIAPDGRMRSIEQTLTEQNIRRLVLNQTTQAQAREIVGPPYFVSTNQRMQREIWEWTSYNPVQQEFFTFLQFSPDGVLREAFMIQDYQKELGESHP
jgi:hypothetical protein